jgi:glycosyltransferase involved in cell wall biosynthesis
MPAELPILLVAPHPADRIVSIERFAECLHEGLRGRESVRLIRPASKLARRARPGSSLAKWLAYLDKFVIFPGALRRAAAEARLVHYLDQSCAIHSLPRGTVPQLLTCTDMIAVRSAAGQSPQHRTRWTGRRLQKLVLAGMQRCDRVACISENTRREVLRFARVDASRLSVVPMGLRHDFAPAEPARAARIANEVGAKQPYLLHVGGNQWYKNREGAIRIFAQVARARPNLCLILAGRPLSPEMEDVTRELGCANRVRVAADCTDKELESLYSAAELLLFPSLHEGFGWPIIEAQACGCPVVTTDSDPMNEVGGESATLIHPENVAEAAAAVQRLLDSSAETRAAIVRAGLQNAARYSRSSMIDAYSGLYRSMLPHADGARAPAREAA